ncbi:MAG: HEAT repeat domain-containing protein [Phormidesmis sp.]
MSELEAIGIEQAIAQLTQGDFHAKWDSSKRFSQQFAEWGDRAIPPLIHHLKTTPNPENQWFLIRALSQFDQPAVVEALAEILATTPEEDLQTEAIKALTRLDSSAIPTLSALLHSRYPTAQRILAASTLARIRRSDIIEPLLSITSDLDPQLRAIALEALGSFHDPRITPALLSALKDIPAVATEAIRALGRRSDLLNTVDLVTPLRACLQRPEPAVAVESAVALGRLGNEAATATLGELLTQPAPTAVKIAAVRALGWIDRPSATDSLTIAFTYAVPVVMPPVKKEIARSLGQTQSAALKPKAAQPLVTFLKAIPAQNIATPEAFTLTQTVISALSRLGNSNALNSLIPLLGNPDSRIRMHALSALKQIDPRAAQAKIQDYIKDGATPPPLKSRIVESLSAW